MNTVRVKICGLTSAQDVDHCVQAGADALGFVFVPASKRYLVPAQARMLVQRVPAFISRVGLFLDQPAEYIHQLLSDVPLSLLQFHGTESAGFCRQFGRPYIKAVTLQDAASLARAEQDYHDAAAILVDSHQPGGLGGTGHTADWRLIGQQQRPLILAGGLTPDNVAQAVRTVHPWAVDVSSGVESAPGIKDARAVDQFIREAKREQ